MSAHEERKDVEINSNVMEVDNREDDGDEDDEDVEDDEDDDDDKVVMEKVFWRSSFVEVLCKVLLTQSIAQCPHFNFISFPSRRNSAPKIS